MKRLLHTNSIELLSSNPYSIEWALLPPNQQVTSLLRFYIQNFSMKGPSLPLALSVFFCALGSFISHTSVTFCTIYDKSRPDCATTTFVTFSFMVCLFSLRSTFVPSFFLCFDHDYIKFRWTNTLSYKYIPDSLIMSILVSKPTLHTFSFFKINNQHYIHQNSIVYKWNPLWINFSSQHECFVHEFLFLFNNRCRTVSAHPTGSCKYIQDSLHSNNRSRHQNSIRSMSSSCH